MQELVKIAYVDSSKCIACEMCIKSCKKNCFTMIEKEGKIVSEFKDNGCDKCGACVKNCPADAIVLNVTKKGKAEDYLVSNYHDCDACEECVKICPEGFEIVYEKKHIYAHNKKHISEREIKKILFLCKSHTH